MSHEMSTALRSRCTVVTNPQAFLRSGPVRDGVVAPALVPGLPVISDSPRVGLGLGVLAGGIAGLAALPILAVASLYPGAASQPRRVPLDARTTDWMPLCTEPAYFPGFPAYSHRRFSFDLNYTTWETVPTDRRSLRIVEGVQRRDRSNPEDTLPLIPLVFDHDGIAALPSCSPGQRIVDYWTPNATDLLIFQDLYSGLFCVQKFPRAEAPSGIKVTLDRSLDSESVLKDLTRTIKAAVCPKLPQGVESRVYCPLTFDEKATLRETFRDELTELGVTRTDTIYETLTKIRHYTYQMEPDIRVSAFFKSTPTALLKTLMAEKKGVCRHSMIVAKLFCDMFDIPARIIGSPSHIWLDVWVPDAGGKGFWFRFETRRPSLLPQAARLPALPKKSKAIPHEFRTCFVPNPEKVGGDDYPDIPFLKQISLERQVVGERAGAQGSEIDLSLFLDRSTPHFFTTSVVTHVKKKIVWNAPYSETLSVILKSLGCPLLQAAGGAQSLSDAFPPDQYLVIDRQAGEAIEAQFKDFLKDHWTPHSCVDQWCLGLTKTYFGKPVAFWLAHYFPQEMSGQFQAVDFTKLSTQTLDSLTSRDFIPGMGWALYSKYFMDAYWVKYPSFVSKQDYSCVSERFPKFSSKKEQEEFCLFMMYRGSRVSYIVVPEVLHSLIPKNMQVGLRHGWGALHLESWLASKEGFFDLVRVLLKYGADPNSQDVYGRTPLGILVASYKNDPGFIACVELLFHAGANPHIPDNEGWTALTMARVLKLDHICRLFETYGSEL